MSESSIGEVSTEIFEYQEKILLENGNYFGPITVAYETYGSLNEDKSNAILICPPLTGDAHAAGRHDGESKAGWWNKMIGPGKAFDTDRYFIICSNTLGGCQGTTGPNSYDPESGKPYGLNFPVITIKDTIKVQRKLLDHLRIQKLFAVAGGSMGGMQALQWAVSYPDDVRFVVTIATTAKSSPQQIAWNEVRRRAIMADPKWNQGDYYGKDIPKDGLRLARMIGHITYLSDTSMKEKFGRNLKRGEKFNFNFDVDFEVENYLHYKGNSFTERFDPNSYLYLTKALDYFDLTDNGERSLAEAFSDVKAKFLVVSITSDWLYPPYQLKEIAKALDYNDVDVTYSEINSSYGHDAFLLEPGQLKYMITSFLSRISVSDVMKKDVPVISKTSSIKHASRTIIESEVTHIPVVGDDEKLAGILTAWDVADAVANDLDSLSSIMTASVITARPDEPIKKVTEKIKKYNISALPVVDENDKICGLISSDSITQLLQGEQPIPGMKKIER